MGGKVEGVLFYALVCSTFGDVYIANQVPVKVDSIDVDRVAGIENVAQAVNISTSSERVQLSSSYG